MDLVRAYEFFVDQGLATQSPAMLSKAVGLVFVLVIGLAIGSFARFYLESWIGGRVVAEVGSYVGENVTQIKTEHAFNHQPDDSRFFSQVAENAFDIARARIHQRAWLTTIAITLVMGDTGLGLSGGQKQCLAIARALLADAPILLMDEVTSALDAQSEHLIQQAMPGLMSDQTTLIIVHRLATDLHTDRIIVMAAGIGRNNRVGFSNRAVISCMLIEPNRIRGEAK